MPMITGPLKWHTVASTIEQAVYAELTTKPDRHSVVPGAIAWDECDCGLLAVSVARIFLTETFPDELSRRIGNACDAPYEVGEVVIQVVRCAPNPDDPLTAPTTAELDASAREVLRDAYEMLKGTSVKLCEMNRDREIADFMLRPLTAQGPTGGCVGNELRAYVALGRN
ncbi:hypothetical protein [Streptomyces caniscabiei]|uniref:Uncharacterized protein n=1 Tax=Streptomyces caniscabiei TaxID=2746961 RepID=A0ABU4MPU0_9ACTN|nr:hypothetical protein [Streptomyces caniscabiei]MBE4788399.1 hypothetical protein [Streptomyces caniscabiei]MDX2954618.1 hypothetical protein [Streptomyces caniscabiei]MDX2986589.1 hypothetical protein [Streptomyces caniscabiei]MDX3039468.1 hypothetical protein [Streptomyces caniscabiei]